MNWDTMTNWNAQIPENWNGRDGLLYEREEKVNPTYNLPTVSGITAPKAKARMCGCGCGQMTPKRNSEHLAYIPGHSPKRQWGYFTIASH